MTTMPRKSLRRQTIDAMKAKVKDLRLAFHLCEAFDDEDHSEDERLMKASEQLKVMENSRYLFRDSKYRRTKKVFDYEDAISNESKNFNDEEFLGTFRMSRESFHLFVEEMKTKKAFTTPANSSHQRPIPFQLLVYLYRIGKEGSAGGSFQVSQYFAIGKGSVENYVRRTIKALHEIMDEVVYWPDKDQRKEMRNRLSAYGFRHCIGIIDGTLVVLDFRPEAFHECYYSRKSFYAINVMIVCDDQRRIIYYNAGWPGSTHDNRVFRNSQLFLNRGEYFSQNEYLLGDSAYSASPIMVQSFKKQSSQAKLPDNHEFFNTQLAQVRIVSEHTIGILTGRFCCLKRNNVKLKSGQKEVKQLVDLIGSCIVMHNLLIKYKEDDIPSEWYHYMEKNIDWSLYDEEEEDIAYVTDLLGDRRQFVFNSLINNYL
jgi:hypothetical protein